MNSRAKGVRGELELSHELNARGFTARRSQQYSGAGLDSADLFVLGLTPRLECKRVEAYRISEWVQKAKEDSRGGPWIIMSRRSNEGWLVMQSLDQWCNDSAYAHEAKAARLNAFEGPIL